MNIHEVVDILNAHNYHGASDWTVKRNPNSILIESIQCAEYFGIIQATEIAEQLHKYLLMCVKLLNAEHYLGRDDWYYTNGYLYYGNSDGRIPISDAIDAAEQL